MQVHFFQAHHIGPFWFVRVFFLFLKYCRSHISPKGVNAWGNSNTFLPSKQNSSWDGSPLFSIFAEHEWFPGTSWVVGWEADLADLHPPARSPHTGHADGHADGQQSHHSSLSWDSYSAAAPDHIHAFPNGIQALCSSVLHCRTTEVLTNTPTVTAWTICKLFFHLAVRLPRTQVLLT